MIQSHVPELVLRAGGAHHGTDVTAGFGARRTAQFDLERRLVIGIFAPVNILHTYFIFFGGGGFETGRDDAPREGGTDIYTSKGESRCRSHMLT